MYVSVDFSVRDYVIFIITRGHIWSGNKVVFMINKLYFPLLNNLCIDNVYQSESYFKYSYLGFMNSCIFFHLRDKAYSVGKTICERLKDSLPRQLFEIAIQAAIGSKIIARETWVEIHFCFLVVVSNDIPRKLKNIKKNLTLHCPKIYYYFRNISLLIWLVWVMTGTLNYLNDSLGW